MVSDGRIDTTVGPMHDSVSDAEFEHLRRRLCPPAYAPHVMEQNVLVVNTGALVVLIDCGIGDHGVLGPHAGRLPHNLVAAGVDPAEVDLVLLTHAHIDHCGGLVSEDGRVRFPRARVVVSERDVARLSVVSADDSIQASIQRAVARAIGAYGDDVVALSGEGEVVPGITALETPGHTPGHLVFRVHSGSESVVALGDLCHDYAIQPRLIDRETSFDADRPTARDTRRRSFTHFAERQERILGYHFPWPGLGWLVAEDAGFRFLPEPMNTLSESVEGDEAR